MQFSYRPSPPDPNAKKEEVDVSNPEEAKALSSDVAAVNVEKLVRRHMGEASKTYKPWYIWGDGKFYLVQVTASHLSLLQLRIATRLQGTPWLEDMDRFPNSTIRIEFEGPEVPQEQLYQIFRPVRHS